MSLIWRVKEQTLSFWFFFISMWNQVYDWRFLLLCFFKRRLLCVSKSRQTFNFSYSKTRAPSMPFCIQLINPAEYLLRKYKARRTHSYRRIQKLWIVSFLLVCLIRQKRIQRNQRQRYFILTKIQILSKPSRNLKFHIIISQFQVLHRLNNRFYGKLKQVWLRYRLFTKRAKILNFSTS